MTELHAALTALLLLSGGVVCGCKTTDAASEPTPNPEERRSDVETCVAELERSSNVRRYVSACSNLWLEESCRAAWNGAMDQPAGQRGEHVIRECMRAYCPALRQPEPALCGHAPDEIDLLDTAPDWVELWTSFNGTVLNRDLRLGRDDPRGPLIARRLLQSVATSGPHDGGDDDSTPTRE